MGCTSSSSGAEPSSSFQQQLTMLEDRGSLIVVKGTKMLKSLTSRNPILLFCFHSPTVDSSSKAMHSVQEIAAAFRNVCFLQLDCNQFSGTCAEHDVSVFPTFVLLDRTSRGFQQDEAGAGGATGLMDLAPHGGASPPGATNSSRKATAAGHKEIFRLVGANVHQLREVLAQLSSSRGALEHARSPAPRKPLFRKKSSSGRSPAERPGSGSKGGRERQHQQQQQRQQQEKQVKGKSDGIDVDGVADDKQLPMETRMLSVQTWDELDAILSRHSSVIVFACAPWYPVCDEVRPQLLAMVREVWEMVGVSCPQDGTHPDKGSSLSGNTGSKGRRSSNSLGGAISTVLSKPDPFERLVWVDLDADGLAADELGIEAVPALLAFRRGSEVKRQYGTSARRLFQAAVKALGSS